MRAIKRWGWGAVAVAALAGVAGCGGGGAPAQEHVSFNAAQQSSQPVTVEGIPDVASLKKETGKPTSFTLREETTANTMRVVAPAEVTVPANFTSASYVVVTGTYDAAQRAFVATQVETRVPTREQQPRG
jgi:hypothetical protein